MLWAVLLTNSTNSQGTLFFFSLIIFSLFFDKVQTSGISRESHNMLGYSLTSLIGMQSRALLFAPADFSPGSHHRCTVADP